MDPQLVESHRNAATAQRLTGNITRLHDKIVQKSGYVTLRWVSPPMDLQEGHFLHTFFNVRHVLNLHLLPPQAIVPGQVVVHLRIILEG